MPQSGGEQLIQLGINSILTSPIGTPGHDQIFGTNTPTVTGVPLLNSLNGDENHNIVNIPTRPSDAFISNNTLGAVAVSEGNAGEIDSIPNFPFENNILNIFEDNDKSYSFRPPVGSNGDMAQTLTNQNLPGLIDMAGGVQQGWLILDLGSMYRLSGVSISLSHGSEGRVEIYATSAVPSVELATTAGFRKIMDFRNTDSTAGTAVAPESVLNLSTTFPDNRTFTFSNQLNSTTLPGQLNPVNNLSQDISLDASGNQAFSRFLIFQFSDFQGFFTGGSYRFKVDISNISIKQLIPTNVLDPNNPKIKRPVVEFDDALLDLEGWRNPRYVGSKLNAKEINKFTPPDLDGDGRGYKGDITYGKKQQPFI